MSDYAFLLKSPYALCREFYIECTSHMMRPRTIVDYDREPWIMDAGTVRITFDSDVRAAGSEAMTFSMPLCRRFRCSSRGKLVLEVKFTELLPQLVRNILPPQASRIHSSVKVCAVL